MNYYRLEREVSFSGTGLHTGIDVKMAIVPTLAGGIVFRRADLPGSPMVSASTENVTETTRGTTLANEAGCEVRTVEHILSALAGLKIRDCIINLDGVEVPTLDGSSLTFAKEIAFARVEAVEDETQVLCIEKPFTFQCEVSGATYTCAPSSTFDLSISLSYPTLPNILPRTSVFDNILDRYTSEIAPARTFCHSSEIARLRSAGFIKGGTITNAVVIYDGEDDVESILRQVYQDPSESSSSSFEAGDSIAGGSLRFVDEPNRHKALDFIGDLSLIGCQVQGKIIADKPGHTGNVAFARFLRQQVETEFATLSTPRITSNESMDINEIRSVIPHRYPFLLVDRIIEIDREAGSITGIKNVTSNEPFFQGHFPDFPIMPGVLIVEAMAQTGGILLKEALGDDDGKLAVFMGIRDAKFRKPVVPGDTIRLELILNGKKFNTYSMTGKAKVDGALVAQAEITVAVIDKAVEA